MSDKRNFSEQEIIRREKLKKYEAMGINPYCETIRYDNEIEDLNKTYDSFTRDELETKNVSVNTSGRIRAIRSSFLLLKNGENKIQVYLDKKLLENQMQLIDLLDLGDILYVEGTLMKTHTDELTIKATKIQLMSKALKVLPDKFHGLSNTEERFRHRYVDLIMNDQARKTFVTRSKIIKWIRDYFEELNYLEVDTPVLQPILGGASAKPFITLFNALNSNFYLRIATELPLKKCVVGGLERVYEIGRIFRNEGVDTTHNPEFTSIEFYEAYSDNEGMMQRTEDLFKYIAKKLNIDTIEYQGVTIDFSEKFLRLNMVEAVNKKMNMDFYTMSEEEALEVAKKDNLDIEPYFKKGHIINALFEKYIEETLIQPTFVYGHPIEVSPLAKKNTKNPMFTDRAELFINRREYANMFTELNDPIDQLERFQNQQDERDAGNDEANEIDWDFVEALEYAMPPTGGCGIGIDRLVMLFTNNESIREVLLFPQLKNN